MATVVVLQGQLEEEARRGRRPALAGPVPTVQHADGAGPPAGEGAGQVDGPHVLLVGVREAGPGVHRRTVDVQPVGVGRGDVGGGAAESPCRRRDVCAQVGDAVGLLGVAGGLQPLGLPVARAQGRREAGRGRHRSPAPAGAARLHRPLVRRVGGERRSRVGDEGLPSRQHRAAFPCEPAVGRVGPVDDDAEGRLRPAPPRRVQGPGERAVVGVDADGVNETVDRECGGPQRASWPRRHDDAPQGPLRTCAVGRLRASRQRAGHCGARGDTGGRGEEGAPAEPVHVMLPESPGPCRDWRRCSRGRRTTTPRCRSVSPSE